MEEVLAAPVIAGLAIGVAFVVIFASIFSSSIPISHREFHMELSIEGLKDTYSVGEKIDFTIRATGYGNYCGYPTAQIVNIDRNEVIRTIDSGIDIDCDPVPYDFDRKWNLTELSVTDPITIDRVGHYKIVANFEGEMAEKYFIVNAETQNAIDKTKDLSEVKEFASYFPNATTTLYFVTTCAIQQQHPCETLVRVPSIVEYSYEGVNGDKIAILRVFLEQKWQGSPVSFDLSCHVVDSGDAGGVYKQIGEGGVSEFLKKEPRCP